MRASPNGTTATCCASMARLTSFRFSTDLNLTVIYEYIVKGLTVQPFFQVIATDDDYVDSDSVLGPDGQEQLEALIDALKEAQN